MSLTPESVRANAQSAAVDRQVTEEEIRDVVLRVVAAANPLLVVGFGSWARGEHRPDSDVDIAVILDEKSKVLERGELQACLHGISMSVDLLDVGLERFERNSLYLDTVYRDIAEEGVFLYGRNEDMRVRGSSIPSRELLLEIRLEEVECVMDRASSGEKTMCFEGISEQIGAFHGHMAIEKMLKAWMIALEIRPPRSRVLKQLVGVLAEAGVDVPCGAVAFEVFEEHARLYRYIERSEPGSIDLRAMRETVRELREFVEGRIAEAMRV